jgi:AraC-like DNA-binding protein
VLDEMDKMGIQYDSIELGIVKTTRDVSPDQRSKLGIALQESGIELIDEKKNAIIEKLKMAIVDVENNSDEDLKTSFIDYISRNMDDNFNSLNTLFAEIEGISIEQYIVRQKIERIKELLVYDKLNLEEIAGKLHYTNTIQLSKQFENATGLTPAHFRNLRRKRSADDPDSHILTLQNPLL